MFKTATELKEFILWAKDNKVKRFKTADIEVELSDLGLMDGLISDAPLSQTLNQENVQVETEPEKDKFGRPVDDPDLFHSVSN